MSKVNKIIYMWSGSTRTLKRLVSINLNKAVKGLNSYINNNPIKIPKNKATITCLIHNASKIASSGGIILNQPGRTVFDTFSKLDSYNINE